MPEAVPVIIMSAFSIDCRSLAAITAEIDWFSTAKLRGSHPACGSSLEVDTDDQIRSHFFCNVHRDIVEQPAST